MDGVRDELLTPTLKQILEFILYVNPFILSIKTFEGEFNYINNNTYCEIDVDDYYHSVDELILLISTFTQLGRFSLQNSIEDIDDAIGRVLPVLLYYSASSLQSLILNYSVTDDHLSKIINECPNLTELTIYANLLEDIKSHFDITKQLKLRKFRALREVQSILDIIHIIHSCPNLEVYYFDFVSSDVHVDKYKEVVYNCYYSLDRKLHGILDISTSIATYSILIFRDGLFYGEYINKYLTEYEIALNPNCYYCVDEKIMFDKQ